ncbi:hypothetical protein Clacol_005094 [Clathrus columnatus]|uniref:Cupredoxin n=1 Tax=Clathrus columnatus TaxID=1419009 RepID=A0AAV5AED7_9AGAM|nr:hypothetical protein Clacol_005094 [Clathrus columnatus]
MLSKLNLTFALAIISTASAAVVTVQVGDGGFVYSPQNVQASKGDIVSFQFSGSPGNHTVSQANFSAPCEQLEGGFDSNFVSIPSGFKGPNPVFNLTIEDDTKPIWFYCKQTAPSPHCLTGMVGSINAPTTGNTIEAFTNAAKALTSLPAQKPGGLQGIGASASSPPSPLQNGASQPPGASTASNSPSSTSGTGSSTGSSTAPVSSNTSPSGSNTNKSGTIQNAAGLMLISFTTLLSIVFSA